MSTKISDFFVKKNLKIEANKDGEEVSNHNFMKSSETEGNCAKLDFKLNKNVKIEAEKELLIILPQQKIEKFPVPIKIEKKENGKKFQCIICKKPFSTVMKLKSHELIHNKKFQCKICDKKFKDNARLKEHVRNIHENPGSFKCSICGQKFNTKTNLNYHQKVHNPDRPKPLKCNKCDYATDVKASFQKHLKSHDKIYNRCDKCSTILWENRPHDCRLDCKFCGKRYSNRISVQLHINKFHVHEIGKEFFECDICGLKVKRKMMLLHHMEAKHADGKPQTFICDLDGKIFEKKEQIKSHIKCHLQPVNCDFCGLKISCSRYKLHILRLHTGTRYPEKRLNHIGIFKCPICSKISTTKRKLANHVKLHNEKTIKCQFCEKMFGCQSRLKLHFNLYHKNPEGNVCKICGKKFTVPRSLANHLKTHDKNRPRNFKCTLCDFATFNQKSLENHLNFHKRKDARIAAIENPHKCPKCPAVLTSKYVLRNHLKVGHSKVLTECDICGKKMKQKCAILEHLRQVHKMGRN